MSRYHINRICTLLILISAIVFQFTIAGNAGNIGTEVIDTVKTLQSISIMVTSPNGGENWIKGTTNTIKWSSYGGVGRYVKIELLKNGISDRIISSRTLNDGSYDWYINPFIDVGNNYKIRITSTSDSRYSDVSDNNFAIINPIPSITVKYPNGGEVWKKGMIRPILWSSFGNIGPSVKIELFKGDVWNRTITSSTSNNGNYNWIVPFDQENGSDYKVKITSTKDSKYNDSSDNYFTIGNIFRTVGTNDDDVWN